MIGSGNITGTVSNSQVNNQVGDQNLAANSQSPSVDPCLEALGKELTRIRRRLEEIHDPAYSADRDDAIEAVDILTNDINVQEGGASAPRNFRRRVKELIGALAPVAEIIGGVAALEAILQHL